MKLSVALVKSPRFLKEKLSQKKLESASFDHEQVPSFTDNNTEVTVEAPAEEQITTS